MVSSASDLILPTIEKWALANADKIYAISKWGSWEVGLKSKSHILITIDREVPLWTDVGQGENRMRVDMLACFHPSPDSRQTADPYNAIELKCLIPSKETAETFWDRRVPTDVEKLTTTKMEPKWYRHGCHLRVLAIGVHNRKFKLPPGFHSHTIPVPSRVESKDAVVIAWWRKTLDAGGVLRDFSGRQ